MICDYPKLYKGELLSSYIYRYHYYTGYKSYCDTAYEIWDNPNKWITSIIFTKDTKVVRERIELSDEDYINYHTILPYYKMFMTTNAWNKIVNQTLSERTTHHKYQLGDITRSYNNLSFRFCPACIQSNYNVLIIKREHQVHGVCICNTHSCRLETYNYRDRRQRIHFEKDLLLKESQVNRSKMLSDIASDISFILDNQIDLNLYDLGDFLYQKAKEEEYLNKSGQINFRCDEQFKKTFFEIPYEYKEIVPYVSLNLMSNKNRNQIYQPLKYVILINKLFGSFRSFCDINKVEYRNK